MDFNDPYHRNRVSTVRQRFLLSSPDKDARRRAGGENGALNHLFPLRSVFSRSNRQILYFEQYKSGCRRNLTGL